MPKRSRKGVVMRPERVVAPTRVKGGRSMRIERADLRQGRLAEAGRAEEQHMVERVAARARRLDEHRQILAHRLLADEIAQPRRAQRRLAALGDRGVDQARALRRLAHWLSSFKPARISESSAAFPPSMRPADAT